MKTRLRFSRFAQALLGATIVALLAAGCGNKASSGPGGMAPPPPGGGTSGPSPLSMTVDGQPWSADPLAAGVGVTVGTPGLYILVASRRVGAALTYTGFELYNIGGPGTYDLGVGFTNFGGRFTFGDATGAWWTPLSGAAGSVTITTLTPTRIAGTFACTLDPLSGDAHGRLTITNGSFDFPIVSNTAGPLPDNAGSRLSATVDGEAWNGAEIMALRLGVGDSLVSCGAGNLAGALGFAVTGATAPGTYSIESGTSTLNFTDASRARRWGIAGRDSGAIVITSISPSRIKGTFGGRLAAALGTSASMHIVGGSFDLGLSATAGPAPNPASMRRAAIAAAETMRRTVARPRDLSGQ
jgi:hypothetical protein